MTRRTTITNAPAPHIHTADQIFDAVPGSGGVTVDNTVDPPALTSTMTIPGAVLVGVDADLSDVVTLRRASVTLTDAQIKALPTTPVVIVPAIAETIIIPVLAIIQTNLAVEYDDISGTCQLLLGNGGTPIIIADEGAANEEAFVSSFLGAADTRYGIALPRAEYIGLAGNAFGMLGAIAVANPAPEGRALVLDAQNGAAPFTGGDAANEVAITVWYGTIARFV